MSVKRYEHYVDSDGGWEIGDAYSAMREEPDGDYVKAEDYDALAAERDALVKDVMSLALTEQDLRAENAELRKDIDAYRGALGYAVPGGHDGRLGDGTGYSQQTMDAMVKERSELQARLAEADALIAKGLAVVHDFLPNIGRCVLQDYQRMNEFCSEAAALTCEHPASLLLRSAETGEPLYCELCDDKSGRRDAEQREVDLQARLAEADALLRPCPHCGMALALCYDAKRTGAIACCPDCRHDAHLAREEKP